MEFQTLGNNFDNYMNQVIDINKFLSATSQLLAEC